MEFFSNKKMSYDVKVDGGTYKLDIKKINTVLVDPAKTEDLVSINILDLIFTQNFNYSLVYNSFNLQIKIKLKFKKKIII